MLTIFTIPKSFTGHNGIIQRNALRSWTLLKPFCEIILCGNDFGVIETAKEFGVKCLPDITRNEFGTPLLDSAFEKVANIAQFPILCYINSDILMLNSLVDAIQHIPLKTFLAIGRRTNINISKPLDFENKIWSQDLINLINKNGDKAGFNWIDYFIFTMDSHLQVIPPFAVGRPEWDNWFIYNARKLRIPIVDITRVCTAIHQNHDYSHVPKKTGNSWRGPEAVQNHELYFQSLGTSGHLCNIKDSSLFLCGKILLPAITPSYLNQRLHTATILYPQLKPVVALFHPLLRPLKWIRSLLTKLLSPKVDRFDVE